jgi:hypothetical protein
MGLWLSGVYLHGIELARRAINAPASSNTDVASWSYLVALALALLSTYLGLKSIRRQRKAREKRMRELAASAVEVLCSIELSRAADDADFVRACSELSGIDRAIIQRRARYYGSLDAQSFMHYMLTEPKVRAMSHFVALLTDLPPTWILDCATNRRGQEDLPAFGMRAA